MTVAELIDELKACPMDKQVQCFILEENEEVPIKTVLMFDGDQTVFLVDQDLSALRRLPQQRGIGQEPSKE